MAIFYNVNEVPGAINIEVYLQFLFLHTIDAFQRIKPSLQYLLSVPILILTFLNSISIQQTIQHHFSSFMTMLYYFNIIMQ